MRNKASRFFETKVSFEKVMEDGSEKKVTEQYVVEADSFTETEASIVKNIAFTGEYDIKAITPAKYKELFLTDLNDDCLYYKAKVGFITLDTKTDKEQKQNVIYLVQANSLNGARNVLKEFFDKTLIDYVITSISETKIIDFFGR